MLQYARYCLFVGCICMSCQDSLNLIVPEKGILNLTESKLTYEEKLQQSYGSNGYQRYDMYLPSLRNTRNPVIVLLHGGAWQLSDKNDMSFLVNSLRAKRVNCAIVNINYRLATTGSGITYQQQVEDIGTLLHKIAAESKDLGISSSFYLVGMSAGGHLALLYASTANSDGLVTGVGGIVPPVDLTDKAIQEGIIGPRVRAVVGGKSYAEAPDAYRMASPVYQYNRQSPPSILFFGEKDTTVPIVQADKSQSYITAQRRCNEQYVLPNQNHDWSAWTDTVDRLIAFAEKNL